MTKVYISPPRMSPLGRVLGSIIALVVLAGMLVFGFFVLAGALVLGLLMWAGLSLRAWWLRRNQPPKPPASESPADIEIIEAEYTVISRRRD